MISLVAFIDIVDSTELRHRGEQKLVKLVPYLAVLCLTKQESWFHTHSLLKDHMFEYISQSQKRRYSQTLKVVSPILLKLFQILKLHMPCGPCGSGEA